MDTRLTVVVAPTSEATRLLMLDGPDELLRARLGAPSQVHRAAAPTLLEGLALWHQEPLRVVLCVESDLHSSVLDLSDGFGFGYQTLHYEVEVVERDRRRRGQRLRGVADFGDLRAIVGGAGR